MEKMIKNVFKLKVLRLLDDNTIQEYLDNITILLQKKETKFNIKYIIDDSSTTAQSEMTGGYNKDTTYPYNKFERKIDNILANFEREQPTTTNSHISTETQHKNTTENVKNENATGDANITSITDFLAYRIEQPTFDENKEPTDEPELESSENSDIDSDSETENDTEYDKYLVDIPSNYQGILIIKLTVFVKPHEKILEGNIAQLHDWLRLE